MYKVFKIIAKASVFVFLLAFIMCLVILVSYREYIDRVVMAFYPAYGQSQSISMELEYISIPSISGSSANNKVVYFGIPKTYLLYNDEEESSRDLIRLQLFLKNGDLHSRADFFSGSLKKSEDYYMIFVDIQTSNGLYIKERSIPRIRKPNTYKYVSFYEDFVRYENERNAGTNYILLPKKQENENGIYIDCPKNGNPKNLLCTAYSHLNRDVAYSFMVKAIEIDSYKQIDKKVRRMIFDFMKNHKKK